MHTHIQSEVRVHTYTWISSPPRTQMQTVRCVLILLCVCQGQSLAGKNMHCPSSVRRENTHTHTNTHTCARLNTHLQTTHVLELLRRHTLGNNIYSPSLNIHTHTHVYTQTAAWGETLQTIGNPSDLCSRTQPADTNQHGGLWEAKTRRQSVTSVKHKLTRGRGRGWGDSQDQQRE